MPGAGGRGKVRGRRPAGTANGERRRCRPQAALPSRWRGRCGTRAGRASKAKGSLATSHSREALGAKSPACVQHTGTARGHYPDHCVGAGPRPHTLGGTKRGEGHKDKDDGEVWLDRAEREASLGVLPGKKQLVGVWVPTVLPVALPPLHSQPPPLDWACVWCSEAY